jgi:hypothetical protein
VHHIGIGRSHAGRRVTLLVADLHIKIITDDGQLLRELVLDPTLKPDEWVPQVRSATGSSSTRPAGWRRSPPSGRTTPADLYVFHRRPLRDGALDHPGRVHRRDAVVGRAVPAPLDVTEVRGIEPHLQRLEMVRRIADEIAGYVVELGVDGLLLAPVRAGAGRAALPAVRADHAPRAAPR